MTAPSAPCSASEFRIERQGDFSVARLEQRVEDCLTCSGTGLVAGTHTEGSRTYEVVTPCERQKLKTRLHLFDAAHLPGVHSGATFASFKPYGAEQDRALRIARDFA